MDAEGLQPADIHRARAAQGWLELGLPTEAAREIDSLSPTAAQTAVVLDVRWAVANALHDWSLAFHLGSLAVELHPNHEFGWIHRSYAARRLQEGGVPRALALLLPALDRFPDATLIPYNLACYACVLQDTQRAMEWLEAARQREARSTSKPGLIVQLALNDPDLQPLHDWIQSLA